MSTGDAPVGGDAPTTEHDAASSRRHALPLAILGLGLAVFAGLSVACRVIHDQSEQRLLQEHTDEASAVLAVSVGQIRAPLDGAATLARVTDGDTAAFDAAMTPYVGDGKPFTSAALYRVGEADPVAVLGLPLGVDQQPTISADQPFVIVDLLASRRLGYAVGTGAGAEPEFIVYGERTLSADPNVRRRTDEPFSQLDYAIYLGKDEQADHLLGASVRDLPIHGRRASAVSKFGSSELLLVMTPTEQLSGALFANLWWIVAALGAVVSVVFALLARRLLARRDEAVALALDNARLFDEQRHIAETLQLGLLPVELQSPPIASLAARYWPAGSAALIGGDFYDAFQVDDQRYAVLIGDVCGKGIESAGLTGLARHTARATARGAGTAAEVLRSVHVAMMDHRPSTYCTMCFLFLGELDHGGLQVTMSLGGHPQPLVRRADGTVHEIGTPGSLLGFFEPELTDTTFVLGPGDVLVLYTDGLTDAPGEQAVPLGEVVDLLAGCETSLVDEIADSVRTLKRRRRPRGSADDTVVLVMRVSAGATLVDIAQPADVVMAN